MAYDNNRAGHSSGPRRDYGQQGSVERVDLSGIKLQGQPAIDLFDRVAANAAETIAAAKREQNKSSQLRRFYDELVMWHDKIGRSDETFTACLPYIRMLKAKVAYSSGRGHVDENFASFFSKIIDEIDKVESLKTAKLFMEAFMAFYKVKRPQ